MNVALWKKMGQTTLLAVAMIFDVNGQTEGDALLEEYFERETQALEARWLEGVDTKEDWLEHQKEYRRQLQEMLGLDPWPERSPLSPVVTGTVEEEEFIVEKLHYQSLPGLYVTGNLYLPKGKTEKLPAVLYVCGHGPSKKDGISFGNKVTYQHHGAWFARNGYVCLVIDTIQLGEIEGVHHGTYREGMWWWNGRGYTPAGTEAWNGIRAIDYLQSRPEVDAERIGITGRSGGGVYSWWVGALDERIKVAVPVAGITSLRNHVVDDCVEGHCDCMYQVNTYRWDFPMVASLMAPRPLLISNTDKDSIFPLEGVLDVHLKTRQIYRLLGAGENLGLQITEGEHNDSQELHIHAFQWFNRFLKEDREMIEKTAVPFFEPEELRVFDALPEDEWTSVAHEKFVPKGAPELPHDGASWNRLKEEWMRSLSEKVFAGWPTEEVPVDVRKEVEEEGGGVYSFASQHPFRLPLIVRGEGYTQEPLKVRVAHSANWTEAPEGESEMSVVIVPRGIGPTAWTDDEREHTHIRRRFMLLGQTLDGMRVWDVCQGLRAIRAAPEFANKPIHLEAEGPAAGIALYAAIMDGGVAELTLKGLPDSHREGPDFLNVMKTLNLPQALCLLPLSTETTLQSIEEPLGLLDWNRNLKKGVPDGVPTVMWEAGE